MINVYKELKKKSTAKHQAFASALVPNIDPKSVLGVKSKDVIDIANKCFKDDYEKFLNNLPHEYLEEYLVQIFIINKIKDYDECIKYLNKTLPYLNCWMLTDSLRPVSFNKNKDKLLKFIDKCLKSKKPFTIREGVYLLKRYYLDDDFSIDQLNKVVSIKSDHYYVEMMQAWYIAEGLTKKQKDFFNLIKKKKISPFVQNKSIQKARESFRINKSLKEELLKYKI